MKKRILALIPSVFFIVGCGKEIDPLDCEHIDVDPTNHICDKCGETLSQCIDENNDHKCDYCGVKMSEHNYKYYENGQHICACGNIKYCVDEDNDNKCDICGHEEEKPLVGEPFILDYDSIPGLNELADTSVYLLEPCEFEKGGAKWITSPNNGAGKGTLGRPSPLTTPGWAEFKVMQFKSNGDGYIVNTTGIIGFTKMTVLWYAKYLNEDTKYFPVISQGPTSAELNVVECDQTLPLEGEDTGKQDGSEKSYEIFKFQTTYTLNPEYGYYKLAGGIAISYIASFSFEK